MSQIAVFLLRVLFWALQKHRRYQCFGSILDSQGKKTCQNFSPEPLVSFRTPILTILDPSELQFWPSLNVQNSSPDPYVPLVLQFWPSFAPENSSPDPIASSDHPWPLSHHDHPQTPICCPSTLIPTIPDPQNSSELQSWPSLTPQNLSADLPWPLRTPVLTPTFP